MKILAPINDDQDIVDKDYVDDAVPTITVSATAPSSPSVGDIWIEA